MSQGMEGVGNLFGEASSSEQRLRIADRGLIGQLQRAARS